MVKFFIADVASNAVGMVATTDYDSYYVSDNLLSRTHGSSINTYNFIGIKES